MATDGNPDRNGPLFCVPSCSRCGSLFWDFGCCGPLFYALAAPVLACARLRRHLGCASPEAAEFVHASAGLSLHAWISWSTALLLLRPEKPGDDPRYAAHFEASGPRVMEMQALARGSSCGLG